MKSQHLYGIDDEWWVIGGGEIYEERGKWNYVKKGQSNSQLGTNEKPATCMGSTTRAEKGRRKNCSLAAWTRTSYKEQKFTWIKTKLFFAPVWAKTLNHSAFCLSSSWLHEPPPVTKLNWKNSFNVFMDVRTDECGLKMKQETITFGRGWNCTVRWSTTVTRGWMDGWIGRKK